MSTITTGSFAKSLWPGVKSWYGIEYNKYTREDKDLFEFETSSQAYEEDVGHSGLGNVPVKNEGSGIQYDSQVQGYTTRYRHVTYGLGFIVTREAYEDDLYNVVARRGARALAFSVHNTLNVLGADVYNNSGTAARTGGDGSTLIASDHENIAGGLQSNKSSATLSEAALESACIAIMKWTNDRGLRINLMPECLVVPPDLVFEAERILNSVLRVDTANNDPNAMANLGKFPKGIKVNHYLTNATHWFIRTNCPDGMKCYERRAPQFDMDNDFDTENAKYKTTFRTKYGWTDWRGLYGYNG